MNEALVTMEGASVMLAGRLVLENIGFTLSRGDFILLRGANGAGKTTLLKCMLGIRQPSAGSVRRGFGPGGAGYVPQVPGGALAMPLLVRDVVAIGRHARCRPWHRRRTADTDAVDRAMATVGITALAARPIRMLSGGEQRKMQLARVLAQEPQALLLDEPTMHLDRVSRHEFMDLLTHVHTDTGVAVLLVTHDEHTVPGCCTRQAVLCDRHLSLMA